MTQQDLLRAQLLDHEGLKLTAYFDSVGKCTIGCGRNLDDKGLTKAEAMYLLDNDIAECITDLVTFAWFERLDAVRQRVVIDMRFNLGPRRFRKFKQMIRALDAARYGDAADEMLNSQWAKQVKRRAVRLAGMMRTGIEVGAR